MRIKKYNIKLGVDKIRYFKVHQKLPNKKNAIKLTKLSKIPLKSKNSINSIHFFPIHFDSHSKLNKVKKTRYFLVYL